MKAENPLNLTGPNVLVCGGSSGIGNAIAATRKLLCFDTQNRARCIDNQTPRFRLCLKRNAER